MRKIVCMLLYLHTLDTAMDGVYDSTRRLYVIYTTAVVYSFIKSGNENIQSK